MAELEPPTTSAPEAGAPAAAGRSANEVALELMKFIAVTTGFGKTQTSGTGFSSKPQSHSPEAQVEALLELYDRCRTAVKKEA
jgi:hypothetical protein